MSLQTDAKDTTMIFRDNVSYIPSPLTENGNPDFSKIVGDGLLSC
jgi:hypothetical protein